MTAKGHFQPIPVFPVTPGLPLIATRKADIGCGEASSWSSGIARSRAQLRYQGVEVDDALPLRSRLTSKGTWAAKMLCPPFRYFGRERRHMRHRAKTEIGRK